MFKSNVDNKSELNIIHMLLEHHQLTNEEYNKIKKASDEIGKTLLETGVELKFISEEKILHTLASTYSLETIDLITKNISDEIIDILDDRFIKQNQIAPFEIDNQILKIAIPDGSKLSLVKTIEKMSGKRVEIFAANLTGIHNFVERITNKIEKSTDSDSTKGSLERN